MTEAEKALLKGLDITYGQKRLDEMGRLHNKLVKALAKSNLSDQDVYMVLTALRFQYQTRFLNKLYPAKPVLPKPAPRVGKEGNIEVPVEE